MVARTRCGPLDCHASDRDFKKRTKSGFQGDGVSMGMQINSGTLPGQNLNQPFSGAAIDVIFHGFNLEVYAVVIRQQGQRNQA